MADQHLLCLGFGFTAQTLARMLPREGWRVTGTTRSAEGLAALRERGVEAVQWPGTDLSEALRSATHIVSSVPPRGGEDPALNVLREHADDMPSLAWLGLLSTTGVYGDHDGDWVDEDAPLVMRDHRGGARATQDAEWVAFAERHALPLHRFRLAGIYGPG
ncbi:MAG: SDR family NAD(P)-dependent oxidoreductase, partial [Pseudomonadota bacterium]